MHAASRAGAAYRLFAVGLLVFALAACPREPFDVSDDDGPTVDATIYALGFCSLRCWRLEECGLDDGIPRQDCESMCVDDALTTLPDDPCWAEGIELRRCIVRWSACEDVPDEDPPDDSGSTCEAAEADLDACES